MLVDVVRFLKNLPRKEKRELEKSTTEVHITVPMDIVDNRWSGLFENIIQPADVVSISIDNFKWKNTEISSVGREISYHRGDTKFNCNLLFTQEVYNKVKRPSILDWLLSYFDTIYLMAYKPIYREEYNIQHMNSIRNVINFYNKLPSDYKKRVNIDGCVDVCAQGKYGCSAGINMMTVYPDGGITRCPYAATPFTKIIVDGKPFESAVAVMTALKNWRDFSQSTKQSMAFTQCKMKDLWPKKI
jgi:hypothetical protein